LRSPAIWTAGAGYVIRHDEFSNWKSSSTNE